MEYALKVLNRHGPVSNRPTRRSRFVEEVRGAYCGGRGVDPKYRSAGAVRVTPPAASCGQCAGSGRVGGDLICLTCRGVGVVSVPVEVDTCPRCGGTGGEGVFSGNACKGQGIV